MPSIHYVNPVSELAVSQESYAQATQDNTFAEQLVQLSIFGYGDPQAARHLLAISRANMGHLLQKEQFWSEVIKQEKDGIKKAFELMKD